MTTLRYRPLWVAVGFGLIAAVIYLSLTPHPPEAGFEESDKFDHLLAYGVLMNWFSQLYAERGRRMGLALGFVAMGIALEWAQSLTGYRTADPVDALANAAGVIAGWLAAPPRLSNWLAGVERRI